MTGCWYDRGEALNMFGRILIVDDDRFVLLALIAMRGRLGCEVEAASSSREALEKLRTDPPFDVVVSDRDMPGMDGLEFLRRCREQAPGMVRLMLSGSTEDAFIEKAVGEGILFRFIPKPCLPHQLAIHIEAALETHRRQSAAVTD
ncbi:MAG: response regulator [Planctomycetia bacterium]|nr:response regulator [Planctomycetia bacterium]